MPKLLYIRQKQNPKLSNLALCVISGWNLGCMGMCDSGISFLSVQQSKFASTL
jgi:hypothetical protein